MILLALVLATPRVINATTIIKNIRFDKLNINNGLAYNSVRSITQDDLGYLWFGTEMGLTKYDGYLLKTYSPNNQDPTSIQGTYFLDLKIDAKGTLWIASNNGLHKYNYDTDNFSVYKHDKNNPNTLSSNMIRYIQPDLNNVLWVSTSKGLDRFDTNTNQVIRYPLPFSSEIKKDNTKNVQTKKANKIQDLLVTKNGSLLVASRLGLAYFDRTTNVYHPINLTKGKQPLVLSIAQDANENIWVGTIGGLYQYNLNSKEVRKIEFVLPIESVFSILIDMEENLWIGTDKFGIFRIDVHGNKINIAPDKSNAHAISPKTILKLFQDHSNKIWLGTYGGGINSFMPTVLNFKTYNNNINSLSCLPTPDIRSVAQFENSKIWLGTTEGLVKIDMLKGLCEIYRPFTDDINAISRKDIYEIFKDSQNTVWIGTGGGLDKFNAKNKQFEQFGKKIDQASVYAIIEADEYLFLGTTKGLYKIHLKNQQISKIGLINGHTQNIIIYALSRDENGVIWIASDLGLFKMDAQSREIQSVNNDEAILKNRIKSLLIDGKNRIWMTIENIGVMIYLPRTKTLIPIGEQLGLKTKYGFSGLHLDDLGSIWVSTLSEGLFKINKDENTVINYLIEDGLVDNSFNVNSFTSLLNGEVVFGGKLGFNIFNPKKIKLNQTPPIVSLSQLNLFGKPISPKQDHDGFKIDKHISKIKNLVLSYKENIFGFDFVAIHFLAPEKIEYRYKMKGLDEEWIIANAQNRRVSYNNLPSGHYQFHLKARSKNGVWGNKVLLKITVMPPPWLTWWAYTIYVTCSLLAVMFFINKRTKALRLRAIELEAVVEKRTRELKIEKQKIDLLLLKKNEEFANVSHEFRTPLTLLLGPIAQVIKRNKNKDEIDMLNIAQKNGYRLLRMVDQLLNLETFRIKSITQKSSQPCGKIITLLCQAFTPLAKENNIKLHFFRIANINFDFTPDGLEKICVNLLSNAIKYTPSGGEVSVSTYRTTSNELQLTVQDSGIGIPQDKLNDIFERYSRILDERSEQATGAGIGLSLVKGIVDIHGGRIQIESQLSVGTKISVYLPIVNEVAVEQTIPHDSSEIVAMELMSITSQKIKVPEEVYLSQNHANTNPPRLLIIEDNPDMQNYIVDILISKYQVTLANDGEQGIEKACLDVPDLIISDIMMPKKDGYQVVADIRNNMITDHIPIILLTARADRDSRLKGWHQKTDEYLTKPFDPEELIIRINNLLSIRDLLRHRFYALVSRGGENTTSSRKIAAMAVTERKKWQFIAKLESIINENYMNIDFKITELASEIGMSDRQLSRKLSAMLNITPTLYLRDFRLLKAAEFLREGVSVSNTAYDVGFASHAYFTKCFKAKYGVTPSEYLI